MTPRISVVIPTFNAGTDISRLLEALRKQQPQAPFEIVAIDSGSTDDTRARVVESGGRWVALNAPFNHGLARDAGIEASCGDLIFLTVQDALPAHADCLARMAAHFDDPRVAGVSSRQIPPPDGPAELQIKAQLDLRGREAVRAVNLAQHTEYQTYSAEERMALYRFDNVGAMLRRSVWEQQHFGACDYAEDLEWARAALEAGHTLVSDFSAPMIHAHSRSFGYEFRRGLLDARVMDERFQFRYRFFKKLNRVALLAGHTSEGAGQKGGGRFAAFKIYAAHALARVLYGAYRGVFRHLRIGGAAMRRWTGGI